MKSICTFILLAMLVVLVGFFTVGAEASGKVIEGVVSGYDGSPVAGVNVNIWDGKLLKRAVTGSDGKFFVSGILPGTSFAIRLTMPDSETVRVEGLRYPLDGGLNLTAGFIRVPAGEELVMKLPSNPSTGYSWTMLGKVSKDLLAFKEKYIEEPEEMNEVGGHAKGRSGNEIWKFKAVSAGRSSILLAYLRPWETPAYPASYSISSVSVK